VSLAGGVTSIRVRRYPKVGLIKLFSIAAILAASVHLPHPTERVLDVAWHHQAHNLTCEAAALKMALSYEGITVDELTLIQYMTSDPRPAQFDAQGRLVTWGDPAQGFVGDPDGRIQRYTGYGVYFQAVARATTQAGADVKQAGSGLYGKPVPPSDVYDAVLTGHPTPIRARRLASLAR
jgi:uncharacterized protein YvpB